MGFLDKLFQKPKIEIGAPVSGEIVPITQVKDDAFSQEIVGKGIAIVPSDGKVYAPCDGELVALFPTGHAFCIISEDEAEVLVHVGIDTVKLNGEHFKIHATQGDTVKKGDLIVEVDLEGVKNAGYDTITPMVISNHNVFSKLEKQSGPVAAGEAAILLSK